MHTRRCTDLPAKRLIVKEIILEYRQKHVTRVDSMAFEFEMGLFPNVLDDAKAKGIDIALNTSPPRSLTSER